MVQRLSAFVHREGPRKRTSQGTRKGVKKASMNKSKRDLLNYTTGKDIND